MNGRPWTDEEIAILREMYSRGESRVKISIAVDRSIESCSTKACELKLRMVKPANPGQMTFTRSGIKIRACLCCGKEFNSEGPHNRLCQDCRHQSLSPLDMPVRIGR